MLAGLTAIVVLFTGLWVVSVLVKNASIVGYADYIQRTSAFVPMPPRD